MIDDLLNNPQNPIEFFRVKSKECRSELTATHMIRAIDSLCEFIGGVDIDFDSFNGEFLGKWVIHLLFYGYSPKTISNNFIKRIATLYNKAVEDGLARRTDAFSLILAKLNVPSAARFDGVADKEAFKKLQRIVRTDYNGHCTKRLAKDMLLFAIYNGGLTFELLAAYKKDDYKGDDRHIREIVERYAKPRNKYLFPLDQIHRTRKQLARTMELMFDELLKDVGLKVSEIPDNTPIDLWCMVAFCCGVPAVDIASCVGAECGSNVVTAFVKPSGVAPERVAEIRTRIIESLTDNPLRWYAMHLRQHVDYEMLTERLKDRSIQLVETYYPMEEIVRKVGHRKLFEVRPVISWLIFFRERATELNRLYHEIGDLAWGYRRSREVGSPYATINPVDIRDYQQAIGTLSPDVRMLADEDVQFNEGDRLVVLGGALNGRPAFFESEIKSRGTGESGRIVYRIRLAGGLNANWIVEREPQLVRKITEKQFLELDKKYNG